MVANVINPPQVSANGAPSLLIGMSDCSNPSFAFRKIVEPRFDGIGLYTGIPINFPSMISEDIIIPIMKAIEKSINTEIKQRIDQSGTSNSPK